MSSYGSLPTSNSTLIESVPLFQANLNNFEYSIENEADIHQREKRWKEIEEKLRQILSIKEQIYQLRYSSLDKECIRESLVSLFHELKSKEKEIKHLQERDRKRFIESLNLEGMEETEESLLGLTKPRIATNTHKEFEYAKTHDYIPPEQESPKSSNAKKTWRKLIYGASAATKFMKIQDQGKKGRFQKALMYLNQDPCRHSTGRTLSKAELRDRIDELRALIKEMKETKYMPDEDKQKECISKLSKRLREMDAVYTEMLLHDSHQPLEFSIS